MPLVGHPLVAQGFVHRLGCHRRAINARRRAASSRSLELGGKSPNIVFADAEIEDAVNGAVSGIFAATGQTCIAGSRLLLQESIHDEFVERLLALAKTARMGDPMSLETQVGPVTTRRSTKRCSTTSTCRQEEGATALGGAPPEAPRMRQGWFVEPTIFTGVDNRMRIAQEEVFGPVLSVIPFKDEEEALAIANDVRFGLAAGVWTSDIGRAFRMSERIQAGTVWVNTYRAVSYMSPFGGYKDSGFGRENGIAAIREYLQLKSVWINTGRRLVART
jgi:(Z)-2-((N-methylformamido)methylene)-5-hydroxybutyrolactone dehydrogenase